MDAGDAISGRERSPEVLDLLASGHPPAFATDSRDRVVFWNRGATELLGRRADEALGQLCYEVLGGRDVFGNRFCYANCPVTASLRDGHLVSGFELEVETNGQARRLTHVTILHVPSVRPDLFTLIHIFAPIDGEGRLARALERVGARPPEIPHAAGLQYYVRLPGSAPPLTEREREVLQWVAAGLQNKEIALELGLSVATVRNHIHNILEKLQVHSKLEAVSLAFSSGWVRRTHPPFRAK